MSHLRGFERFCIAQKIEKIDNKAATLFLDYLLEKGREGTTVNNYRRTLKMIFKGIESSKNLSNKAFIDTKKVPEHVTPRGYFLSHHKEFIKNYLLEHDPKMWDVCKFLYWLCIRTGNELLNVKIKDIDFSLGQLVVNSKIAKNNRTEFVKIPPQYLDELQVLVNGYSTNYYLFGKNGIPSPELVTVDYWSKRFSLRLKQMKFNKEGKKISLYSFKNTWCVDAYKKGYRIKEIMYHLRHKNIYTTDKYLNSLGLHDSETFDKMGSL